MVFLEELLSPLAALLHVPIGVLTFAALMVIGVAGHTAISLKLLPYREPLPISPFSNTHNALL